MKVVTATALALLATACAVHGDKPATATNGPCRHDGLDRFIGQIASAEVGAQLLALSGARSLRWGAPGMAMTMDYRPDRLTVSYDGKMAITSARCG